MVAYDFSGMGDSGVREAYPDEVRLRELMDVARQTRLFENGWITTIIAHSCGGGHIPMIAIPDARHHLMLDQPVAFASVLNTIQVCNRI